MRSRCYEIPSSPLLIAACKQQAPAWEFRSSISDIHPFAYTHYLLSSSAHNFSCIFHRLQVSNSSMCAKRHVNFSLGLGITKNRASHSRAYFSCLMICVIYMGLHKEDDVFKLEVECQCRINYSCWCSLSLFRGNPVTMCLFLSTVLSKLQIARLIQRQFLVLVHGVESWLAKISACTFMEL